MWLKIKKNNFVNNIKGKVKIVKDKKTELMGRITRRNTYSRDDNDENKETEEQIEIMTRSKARTAILTKENTDEGSSAQEINASQSSTQGSEDSESSGSERSLSSERPRFSYSFNANTLSDRTTRIETVNLNSKTVKKAPEKQKDDKKSEETESNSNQGFSCNICFDTATNPVLTLCGHLFCWPCLHRWLVSQARNPLCPVCKAGCGKDKVIPVYGRGAEMKDPRLNESIPERPRGQRPEPQSTDNGRRWDSYFYPGGAGNFGPQVSFNAGLGLFPGGVSFQYTFDGNQDSSQQAFVSRLFLLIGILILLSILFA